MTIEQLCECSADELEKMTDAELLEHFKPYLSVTRPELAVKPVRAIEQSPVFIDPKKKRAMEALAAAGLDMGFLKKMKGK